MLTTALIEEVLSRLPALHIGVVGDLFLDRYLDLDARLTEPSVETGLDAYQIVGVRCYPGAAGTILNNLVALGVGRVSILSVIGDDGEGYELRRALEFRGIDQRYLLVAPERFTPTYTKPMLHSSLPSPSLVIGGLGGARELNRLDHKNRTPMPQDVQDRLVGALPRLFEEVDALLVLDQVSELDCGVVADAIRVQIALLGGESAKLILADSRQRIGNFRNVSLKPNEAECRAAIQEDDLNTCVWKLARFGGQRAVFCTCGDRGILLATPETLPGTVTHVPAFLVAGPIDSVGAGDSTSAGIACAFAAGAPLAEAAAFGNLVASITIQQLGTTGAATPEQVRQRWQDVTRVR